MPPPGEPKPARHRTRRLGVRTRLHEALEKLEALGVSIPGASFFMAWWKRLGIGWAVALFALFFIPISQFSLLNFAMKNGVPYMLGDFGVMFEAEDWDLDLIGLRGTAHNVRIARDARSAPVLTANEIEFNATLGVLVGRLFGWPQVFDEIVIRDGDIRLERTLSGDWSWLQFVESVPVHRRDAVTSGEYQTRNLVLERVRFEYLEHVPGDSGGGVIQTTQARVHADDLYGQVKNLVVPETPRDLPTTYDIKGRSADGIIHINGRGAFFAAAERMNSRAPVDVKLYLENIGMGAYARTVTTTALLPVRGALRGTVEITRNGDDLTCRSTLIADEVEFAPNPRLVLVRAQYDQLARELRGYRTSGPFDPCTAQMGVTATTATSVLASFNTQTTMTAPPMVRATAASDSGVGRTLGDSVAADISGRLAREAGKRTAGLIGGNSGKAVEQEGGNALSKGVKGVGRGFKKLFGR